jgi:DegT/DnrJ/EryC1/StrS aminotransferase family
MIINVTKPFLPEYSVYESYLKGIWKREWLTNHGPLVNELELKLKERLSLDHLLYLSNGTIALQIAIKALELKGEIITTPFSYVATTSSIVWEGCTPVMVDICPHTLNIDPEKIEACITPRTSAILATHVFGNPCDIEAIEVIAKKHNLKVIYDAAMAIFRPVAFMQRNFFIQLKAGLSLRATLSYLKNAHCCVILDIHRPFHSMVQGLMAKTVNSMRQWGFQF